MPRLLTTFDPPFFRVVHGSSRDLAEVLVGTDRSGEVEFRIVRGSKMRLRTGLFDEMAAALQFPWYFGENWDAFDECINDLGWLRERHIVVGIADATGLLAGEPDQDGLVFSDIMRRAVASHASGGARSLHVILQVPDGVPSERLIAWFGRLALL